VLPCPAYLFRDMAYREFLRNETAIDFVFCPESQPFEEVLESLPPKASFHPMLLKEWDRGAAPLILKTSGSSGKKFKYILHDYRRFSEKFHKLEPRFER